ncbi:hypothetical protein D3C83_218470 [compost metagenome]
MVVGGIPLGIVTGLAFYVVTRWGLAAYQRSRRERLAERRAERENGFGAEQ